MEEENYDNEEDIEEDEDADNEEEDEENNNDNNNNINYTQAVKRRKYKPLSQYERERRRLNCEHMRKIKAMKRKSLKQKSYENNYAYNDEQFDDENIMDLYSKHKKEDLLKNKKVNYDMPEKKKQAIVKKKYKKDEKDIPTSKYKPIALTDEPPSLNPIFPLYSKFL